MLVQGKSQLGRIEKHRVHEKQGTEGKEQSFRSRQSSVQGFQRKTDQLFKMADI